MAEMTKTERLRATISGQPVDRVPIAFWRHWPGDDQQPQSLARATLDYYRQFDWDVIKIPPSSTYCIDDWGAKHAYGGRVIGERDYQERLVRKPEDWDRIEPLDVTKGTYGRQLECLKLVLERKGSDDVPVVHTLFNPLSMATHLSGNEACSVAIRRHPERMERVLAALTETCANFAQEVLKTGADGVFLSTAAASYDIMSAEEYRRWGRPGDLAVLEASSAGWVNMLHLHGQYPMFRELADYPIHAINWHDRAAGPSLAEAGTLFSGALIGGVEQWEVLQCGTPADVEAQVLDAIEQLHGLRLMVGAGCTYPVTVPVGNLLTAREAVVKAAKA
jgi:uroporphyrinogen decarboxylase